MFLLDNLLMWPASGLLWIVEELQQAAAEERVAEGDSIREELRELYQQLESGAISEETFSTRETVLLDRLEEIEIAMGEEDQDEDEDDEEEDDDDGDEVEDDDDCDDDDEDEDGERLEHRSLETEDSGLDREPNAEATPR